MTSASGVSYEPYLLGPHTEWLMSIGPERGRPILFIPPLFEEMNRTRALLTATMRLAAVDGFRCCLPDLPGTGESERALDECCWRDWVHAIDIVANRVRASDGDLIIASIRGGALLTDVPASGFWRLAPVEGASLLRDLDRSALGGGAGTAGYMLGPSMRSALTAATPPTGPVCRTVRLRSDSKPADQWFDGPALWRRSEPSHSPELARLIAADIKDWAHRCGVC